MGPILFILYTQPLSDVIQPLSDVISHHSVSNHMFADDSELYKSDSPSEAFTLSRTIEVCISDVKVWVVQNKLQLNDDKRDILLIGSAPGSLFTCSFSASSLSKMTPRLRAALEKEMSL